MLFMGCVLMTGCGSTSSTTDTTNTVTTETKSVETQSTQETPEAESETVAASTITGMVTSIDDNTLTISMGGGERPDGEAPDANTGGEKPNGEAPDDNGGMSFFTKACQVTQKSVIALSL